MPTSRTTFSTPVLPEAGGIFETDHIAKKLRAHLLVQHGLKLKKREVLEALGIGLGYPNWASAQLELDQLLQFARQRVELEARLYAETAAVCAIDADLSTLVVGDSGVGKTTAVATALAVDSALAEGRRPVLVLLERSRARDHNWSQFAEALENSYGAELERYKDSFDDFSTARGAVVHCPGYLPDGQSAAKLRVQQTLAWACRFAGQNPVLVMDEPQSVLQDRVGELLYQLPMGVTLVWATSRVSEVPAKFWYRFKRIVAMASLGSDHELAKFMLELRHPQPLTFLEKTQVLTPRRAMVYVSDR
jgi:hypothetical protein